MPNSRSLYDDLVDRVRELTVERRFSLLVSDDTDAWMEGAYGYSPNNEHMASAVAGIREADGLVQKLIKAGAEAIPAVVRGLRMQGQWRLHLLPFAESQRHCPEIREVLTLVARRRRDPCRWEALRLLEGA